MNIKQANLSNRRVTRGFTLIELMIVVAIVGILARIAYPAYVDYVRRGTLPDAFSALSSAQVRMEQYYQDNRTYSTGSTCGFIPPDTKYFTFTCPTYSASTYKIVATGQGAAAGHVYTAEPSTASGGGKATTTFKGNSVSNKTCWLSKSTSDC